MKPFFCFVARLCTPSIIAYESDFETFGDREVMDKGIAISVCPEKMS